MPDRDGAGLMSEEQRAIERELLATFRTALDDPDLGPEERFLGSGGDSLTVMEVILDLEKRTGVSISAAEFMALDSASLLAAHVVEQQQALAAEGSATGASLVRRSSATVVQEGGAGTPLVCVYGQSGKAAYAIPFGMYLPDDQPLATLSVSEERALAQGVRSLRDGAASDAEAILERYPGRRCALLGFSLGAHVALAIGHELAARGADVPLVAVLDDSADLERRHFGALAEEVQPSDIIDLHQHALRRSPAEPIAARIVYFCSDRDAAFHRSDPTRGWGEVAAGGATVVEVPVGHHEFVQEPGLRAIAPRLSEELRRPSAPSPSPSAAQMLRYQARQAARHGDLSAEIASYEAAVADDAEQPVWLYANLAEAYFQRGDEPMALRALAEARRRDPWQLSLDLRFLKQFERSGLDEEVADVVTRLADLRSDHPSVSVQKTTAYLRLGLVEDAARELETGLAMAPDDLRLCQLQVRLLRQRQNWSELARVSQRLVAVFPGKPPFRHGLMVASINSGQPARALEFREAITTSSPKDPEGMVLLARALLSLQRPADALALLDDAMSLLPDRPGLHQLRAQALAALGRSEDAAAGQLATP